MTSTMADVADLEREAAEASARAAAARTAVIERSRVEDAAADRARELWLREQFEARRPHDAVTTLNAAWDTLVDDLAAGSTSMVAAWAKFTAVRAECAVTINMFAGFRAAPQLARRWDVNHREHLTVNDALVVALERVTASTEEAGARLDAEREAVADAAVAALSADAPLEAVAVFHDEAGWPHRVSTGDARIEAHPSGVGYVHTSADAHAVRSAIAATEAGGYLATMREIDQAEADRITAGHDAASAEPTPTEADKARDRDLAKRKRSLPYKVGEPEGRKPGRLTDRSDATPTVDRDRP